MKTLTCNPSDLPYKLVNHGVDTLVVNVRFADGNLQPVLDSKLPDDLIAQFESWKALAQEAEEPVAVPGLKPFRGADLLIYPHGAGKGQWRWLLKCPSVNLCLSRGRFSGLIAQVRFASSYLWSCEDKETHEQDIWPLVVEVGDFLYDLLGGRMVHMQVSEIHLCADVAGIALEELNSEHFLSRARVRTHHNGETPRVGPDEEIYFGHHLETLAFGTHDSPLSACIYDKRREIKKSGKTWFEFLWKQHGWDGEASVTRIECRWKREALHEIKEDGVFHGIEAVEDLDNRFSYLWTYCTGHTQLGSNGLPDGWLRYVEPSDDENRSRWPVHPAWQVVQTAFCQDTEQAVVVTTGEVLDVPASPRAVLIRERQRQMNLTRLAQQMNGCASTLSAWLSEAGTDTPLDFQEVCAWLEENLPTITQPGLSQLPDDAVSLDLLKAEFLNRFVQTASDKQGLYGRRSAFDL